MTASWVSLEAEVAAALRQVEKVARGVALCSPDELALRPDDYRSLRDAVDDGRVALRCAHDLVLRHSMAT